MRKAVGQFLRILACRERASRGQVAIIMILIIAAGLIFYAASLNVGKMGDSKILVTIASNTSAAMLASDMASYGQALSSTSLQGKRKLCALTGVVAVLVTIIIIIIFIILTVISSGGFAAAMGPSLYMAIAGLVLAIASLAIQVLVVQPGLTEAWNRIVQETLDTANQFTEYALQNGLTKAATDPVQVPDVTDLDGDRKWVKKADLPPDFNPRVIKDFEDLVSRYGVYYGERLKRIADIPVSLEIENFVKALKELLYEGEDGWGLYDPVIESECEGKAECHPCCVPYEADVEDEDGTILKAYLRPDECERYAEDPYWSAQCTPASPYQRAPWQHPWIYDPFYENPDNAFFSFREQIGFDDEHKEYYKNPDDPGSDPGASFAPGRQGQIPMGANEHTFRMQDATGFYVPPEPTPTWPDPRKGIFPMLYKFADWGVDLNNVRDSLYNDSVTNDILRTRMCFWCDTRSLVPNCPNCLIQRYPPFPQPNEVKTQLRLPLDPVASGMQNNKSYFVDGPNQNQLNFPPVAPDRITKKYIVAEDSVCAEQSLDPATANGFWKRGANRFCSQKFPYADCGTGVCAAGPGAAAFPDDPLDGIVYRLPDFFEDAEKLLNMALNIKKFSATFKDWYPIIARWIETPALCHECDFTPEIPTGILHIWLNYLKAMRDRLSGWITNFNPVSKLKEGYVGTGCVGATYLTEAWCVPPATCALTWDDEEASFDSNKNGVRGDVEDIIACLKYNVDSNSTDAVITGNAERFQACFNECGVCQADATKCAGVAAVCGGAPSNYLPRSLIKNTATGAIFDPTKEFRDNPVNVTRIAALLACKTTTCPNCLNTCDNTRMICTNACSVNFSACSVACASNYTVCLSACPVGDLVCQNNCLATRTACDNGCSVNQTTCNNTCTTNWTTCRSICSCEGFNCLTQVLAPVPTAYHTALNASQGVCKDPVTTPNSFLEKLKRSIPEAKNQAAKFSHRAAFLQSRVNEIKAVVADVFDPAIKKFEDFLNGPAAALIRARKNYKDSDYGLPFEVIYGWQDFPRFDKKAGSPARGKWHIVKVEARVPNRCENLCGFKRDAASEGGWVWDKDPGWPRIKTSTKGFLKSKRCYELVNTGGAVKFRTTRYDEGEEDGNLLRFPNKVPIWQFRGTTDPSRDSKPKSKGFFPGDLSIKCAETTSGDKGVDRKGSTIATLPDGTPTDIYNDAFMVTRFADDTDCWTLANALLSVGVVNETCAQYYWHKEDDTRRGMSFRFIKCKDF